MLRLTAGLLRDAYDPSKKGVMERPSILDQLGVNYRSSSIVLDEFQDKAVTDAIATSAYESGDVLRAGARAPEAPQLLETRTKQLTSLFSIFRPYLHTVLIFPSQEDANKTRTTLKYLRDLPEGTVQSVVVSPKSSSEQNLDGIEAYLNVEDLEGYALKVYGVSQGESRIVVVRPDGYVGAIVRSAEGVKDYFSKILINSV